MVEAFKRAVESLWNGRCMVAVRRPSAAPSASTGRNTKEEVILHENIPCRISYSGIRTAEPLSHAYKKSQDVVLYTSPDISVPAGSKITVIQNGVAKEYERSGEPAVYRYHQEIPLELFKGWT